MSRVFVRHFDRDDQGIESSGMVQKSRSTASCLMCWRYSLTMIAAWLAARQFSTPRYDSLCHDCSFAVGAAISQSTKHLTPYFCFGLGRIWVGGFRVRVPCNCVPCSGTPGGCIDRGVTQLTVSQTSRSGGVPWNDSWCSSRFGVHRVWAAEGFPTLRPELEILSPSTAIFGSMPETATQKPLLQASSLHLGWRRSG